MRLEMEKAMVHGPLLSLRIRQRSPPWPLPMSSRISQKPGTPTFPHGPRGSHTYLPRVRPLKIQLAAASSKSGTDVLKSSYMRAVLWRVKVTTSFLGQIACKSYGRWSKKRHARRR